jgi:Ca-activated chloride channel family protein
MPKRERRINPEDRRRMISRAMRIALQTFLILAIIPGLVAWDLPFLSQRVRGDNDFHAGRYERAIEHYQNAAEGESEDWELHYNLGTSYYHSGNWSKAVEELEYSLALADMEDVSDAQLADIHHNLGLSYLQLDDCDHAVPELTAAAELAPENEDIARNAEFAGEYCEASGGQCSNDESSQGDQEEQQQECQGSESQDQQDQGGQSDQEQQEESQQQSDQQEQSEEAGDQGDETQDQSDEQGDQEESQQSEDEGGQDENENREEGASQGDESTSPPEVPDDGLNLSDAQVEELLEYMSRLERQRAPRYFRNPPEEGDQLDNETMADLLRRLIFGLPLNDRKEEAEDGVDW